MKFPVNSLLAGNLAFSETSSQLTPPSSGESLANSPLPGSASSHDSRRLQPRWDPTFSEHSYRFRRKLARVDSSTDVLMMFYDRGTSSERHG